MELGNALKLGLACAAGLSLYPSKTGSLDATLTTPDIADVTGGVQNRVNLVNDGKKKALDGSANEDDKLRDAKLEKYKETRARLMVDWKEVNEKDDRGAKKRVLEEMLNLEFENGKMERAAINARNLGDIAYHEGDFELAAFYEDLALFYLEGSPTRGQACKQKLSRAQVEVDRAFVSILDRYLDENFLAKLETLDANGLNAFYQNLEAQVIVLGNEFYDLLECDDLKNIQKDRRAANTLEEIVIAKIAQATVSRLLRDQAGFISKIEEALQLVDYLESFISKSDYLDENDFLHYNKVIVGLYFDVYFEQAINAYEQGLVEKAKLFAGNVLNLYSQNKDIAAALAPKMVILEDLGLTD
ncbi:MAG: hypothetical protein UT55_C0045G0002 [Candidatus Peregrinibacteria bacterium GW2011_GWE2_39_6]|nr:MAG: hypothetical protein UT36_C0004G0051 [Candidatus Peregrinibacteria bacterium GW2011_GWF2_39_17]KKR25410.1 MAG: hypothetical protein UT55_C0045G0002 [Candidatus Peregrinibacteria bacterium GW2011_GWE2_39_6]HCW32663.1 hypothetical protein [Candidatus Peregrinibacteria bacterium]